MRSVVFTETGGSDVLHLVERDVPEPGPGEVRVRVVVSGVNPTDWKSRQGLSDTAGEHAEIVPNQDGAGVVDAVGDGVTGLTAGDRVWVYLAAWQRPSGTAQEYTVLPAERVHPLPDRASFDLGADLGVPAVTAHRALTSGEFGPERLSPGALDQVTVLVAGGAGAVGNAAIQLAVWAGATVITTVSSEAKADLARAAGAQHVVDYTDGLDATVAAVREIAPDGVDLVVEVAPAANLPLDLQVIRKGATIAIYANNGGDEVTLKVRETFATNVRMQFVMLYTVDQRALDAAVGAVTAAVETGGLGVGEEHGLPLHRFPLEQTAAAHAAVEDGAVGKVLIDVSAIDPA